MTIRPKVLFHTGDVSGSYLWRAFIPLAYLGGQGLVEGYGCNVIDRFPWLYGKDRMFNVLGTQRILDHSMMDTFDEVSSMMYMDLDDNFFDIPRDNPAWIAMNEIRSKDSSFNPDNNLRRAIDMVQIVTTTSDTLAERIRRETTIIPKDIRVIPNAYWHDYSDQEIAAQRNRMLDESQPIRIGWWGSEHHQSDFKIIEKELVAFHERHHRRVELVFMGWAPLEILKAARFKIQPWVKPRHFFQALFELDVDICIAPLIEDEFSICKSNIKYIETGMYNRCFLGQRHPLWNDDIAQAENGFIWDTAEELIEQLEYLVTDRLKVFEVGAAARAHVDEHYHISKHADKWLKVFTDLVDATENITYGNPEEVADFFENHFTEDRQRLTNELLKRKLEFGKATFLEARVEKQ